MCFIDFKKAFDTVKHDCLIEAFERSGVDGRHLKVLTQLYLEQKLAVRVGEEVSEWFCVERGVRQGCVSSPDLFSLYNQLVMDELVECEGVRIGGKNVNNIGYADDMVLIADSEEINSW